MDSKELIKGQGLYRGWSFSGQISRVRIGEVRILSPDLESSGISEVLWQLALAKVPLLSCLGRLGWRWAAPVVVPYAGNKQRRCHCFDRCCHFDSSCGGILQCRWSQAGEGRVSHSFDSSCGNVAQGLE